MLLLSSVGCRVPYLLHVGAGQVRLLLDRERFTPETEARLTEQERRGLGALREALVYGETIGLAKSTSHRHLIDRGGRGLVTVVTAAPRDRLESVTWWFPIVGSVPYRGYFDPALAGRFAESLTAQELDTYVRPALLYSTLGWFDDPVPRALLRLDPFEVADTVLHERVHETIFVSSDGRYNEGIAVFIAHEATLRLYADRAEDGGAAERAFADQRRFAGLLERLASRLEGVYQKGLPADEILEHRRALFQAAQTTDFEAIEWETDRYSGFPRAPLSNAYIVARRTYLGDLPCFEAELASLKGDLERFVGGHLEEPGRRLSSEGACRFGPAPALR
ncbi:MAG: aminopeptidase [Myxococcota bacterium]